MKNVLVIIWLFLGIRSGLAQKIDFSRVCNGGNNNSLFWQLSPDSCTILGSLKVHARDAAPLAFSILDSSIGPNLKSYTHNNANVPSSKPWEYFFEYRRICGSDTLSFFSDTLGVDDQKPDSTILDSASVDPITGFVNLGWSSNKTPDFSSYYVYNYDRADPRLIENYKDTFFTDINPINPASKSLSYDITSSDSCDNRKDYGNYKHQTICLSGSIDTCINQTKLSWTPYIGWPVRVYEVYKKLGANPYFLLDSVPGTIMSYSENNLPINKSVQYFIRAKSLTNPKQFSSSSNASQTFITGSSVNPSQTKISYVSNNSNGAIELEIKRNPLSNYSTIDLFRTREGSSPIFVHSFINNEDYLEDLSAVNTIKYEYLLVAKNMCNIPTDTSAPSNNLVLAMQQNTNDLNIFWRRYFTWNGGVKNYIIYRATGTTLSDATNFTAISTLPSDTFLIEPIPSTAVACYYAEAEEMGGVNKSKSNIVCYIKTGKIYYPNAISVFGVNTHFGFQGEGIDLSKSSLVIYNRWGAVEYTKTDISSGWEARNNKGEVVPADVYFFVADISQGAEIVKIHGNITVIK